jgi:hypothetical protein
MYFSAADCCHLAVVPYVPENWVLLPWERKADGARTCLPGHVASDCKMISCSNVVTRMSRWQAGLSRTLVTYDHQQLVTCYHQLLLPRALYRDLEQRRSEDGGFCAGDGTLRCPGRAPSNVLACHKGTGAFA